MQARTDRIKELEALAEMAFEYVIQKHEADGKAPTHTSVAMHITKTLQIPIPKTELGMRMMERTYGDELAEINYRSRYSKDEVRMDPHGWLGVF